MIQKKSLVSWVQKGHQKTPPFPLVSKITPQRLQGWHFIVYCVCKAFSKLQCSLLPQWPKLNFWCKVNLIQNMKKIVLHICSALQYLSNAYSFLKNRALKWKLWSVEEKRNKQLKPIIAGFFFFKTSMDRNSLSQAFYRLFAHQNLITRAKVMSIWKKNNLAYREGLGGPRVALGWCCGWWFPLGGDRTELWLGGWVNC